MLDMDDKHRGAGLVLGATWDVWGMCADAQEPGGAEHYKGFVSFRSRTLRRFGLRVACIRPQKHLISRFLILDISVGRISRRLVPRKLGSSLQEELFDLWDA